MRSTKKKNKSNNKFHAVTYTVVMKLIDTNKVKNFKVFVKILL